MPSTTLSRSSTLLPNAAAFLFLLGSLVFGIQEILNTGLMVRNFESNTHTPQTDPAFPSTLMRFMGVRDLCLGIAALAIWYRGDRHLLGFFTLTSTLIPFVDGFSSKAVVGFERAPGWGPSMLVALPVGITMPLGLALMGVFGE